jgi:hypothetical protein
MKPLTNIAALARTAGILYIALFVLGPFVFLFGKATALVPGDPAASAAKVLAMGTHFRLSLLVEAAIFLIEVVLAAILYTMFLPVSRTLSLSAAFARIGEAVVQAVNLLPSGLVLLFLGGAGSLAAFSPEQREALGHVFLAANAFVILVWGIFFGFHLLVLGYLVRASGFLPRWIGGLLLIAGAGYLAQSCGTIVWPAAKGSLDVLVVAMAIPGELALTLWLVIKGVDVVAWNDLARS